ncbi:MAG: hypothetical protein AAGI88_24980 [Pseudomonadota bacterium]
MTTYAIVIDGSMAQIGVFSFTPNPPWVVVPDGSGVGDEWDGTTRTPAPDPGPQARLRLSVREFREQFTMAEKQAIYTAAKANVDLEIFLDDLRSVEFVDLDFPQTVASVQTLETAGLLASGRAAEILAGIVE